jgi:hypothetical protein
MGIDESPVLLEELDDLEPVVSTLNGYGNPFLH